MTKKDQDTIPLISEEDLEELLEDTGSTLSGLQPLFLVQESEVFDADASLRRALEKRALPPPLPSTPAPEARIWRYARQLQKEPMPVTQRMSHDEWERADTSKRTALSLKLSTQSELLVRELPTLLRPFDADAGLLALVVLDLTHQHTMIHHGEDLALAERLAQLDTLDEPLEALARAHVEPSPLKESILSTASHYLVSYCFEVRGLKCTLLSLWDRPRTNIVLVRRMFEAFLGDPLLRSAPDTRDS